jgi:endonuclease/exonuclease/phosphatase family metal-dependent hydrolase
LLVVSFNIKFSRFPDRAARLIETTASLRNPDILLLQEMDAAGTGAVADALGLSWVYYPNTIHPLAHKDFGCAIQSRHPMRDDRKILLPYEARFRQLRRAAVAATIDAGGRSIRAYNVHLATMIDNGPRQRRDQLRVVLGDASAFDAVILAGDFNSPRVADVALARGFSWPTRRIGPTNAIWAMDHVLLKGLELVDAAAFGSVPDRLRASDHKPVWARVRV